MNDSDLRYIQRVLEGNAPDEDRERAAQMVRDIRRSQRIAPSDEDLKALFDGLDFSNMVTADDLFYLIARAVLERYGQASAECECTRMTQAVIEAERKL